MFFSFIEPSNERHLDCAGCERTLKPMAMAAYERAYRQAGMAPEDARVLLKGRAEALGV